jgi:hypothetical protein
MAAQAKGHGAARAGEMTLAEALELLEAEGFEEQLRVVDAHRITCSACGKTYPAESLTLKRLFRIEGSSDPADEMAVAGIQCACGAKGTEVFSYGPAASPEESGAFGLLKDERETA